MSAQDYWGNGGNTPHQNYDHSQRDEYQHGYSAPYGQGQAAYQPQQQHGYTQDDEQLNWGYGGGNQHQQSAPPQGQGYYETQGQTSYETQHYSSESQHRGYDQPYPSHSQPQDQYQIQHGYPSGEHLGQPPSYDHNRQASPSPYQSGHHVDQGYPSQSDTYQPYPGAADPAEGERGLLGAVGGAVAGGFAGHQAGHGFLGAVGGAYAGHKLEDHVKDKKKKKKEKHGHHGRSHSHGRRGSSSSSSSSSSSDDEKKKKKHHRKHGSAVAATAAGGAVYAHSHHSRDGGHGGHEQMAGNFSSSCSQISLDRDYDLIASCSTLHGGHKLSSIDLNGCLTNSWGRLEWARGGGFGHTSRNVRLVDGGRVLEAELGDGQGGWNISRIRLDERITNNDGDLQFLD